MRDIDAIMKAIPHRYPFLLVDRVLEEEPGKRIKTLKNVTANEPHFQGHFPFYPIMPGVLIVEAMAQSAGILFSDEGNSGKKMLFMGIDACRFRKEVRPGDQLILDVEVIQQRGGILKFKGVASVDGKKVAEAEMMAALDAGNN
ncbi:MAG TPA: 3-hydroxyacyl-ACP dehydratase FabZ [bacterium]|nr:3-hydroxyacyl-ACP dehydratase FabZ [bacterium]